MKTGLSFWRCCLPLLVMAGTLSADPQPQMEAEHLSYSDWQATWDGVAGRAYFVQSSTDLQTWTYLPLVAFGTGSHEAEIDLRDAPKIYLRLKYADGTDATTLQEARDMDFDGDLIPNAFEVEEAGSDPLDGASKGADSDSDGLPDGWELYLLGGLSYDGDDDPDGDSHSNSWELANGTHPLLMD